MPSLPMNGSVTAAVTAATVGAGAWFMADQMRSVTIDLKQVQRDRLYRSSAMARISQLGSRANVYHMLQNCNPHAEALWFEGRTYLYKDVLEESSRLACLLEERGIGAQDVVALFMTNSPEMVFAFYAVSQLGAVPALVNSTLRFDTLAHSIATARPRLALATADLTMHLCAANTGLDILSLNLGAFGHTHGLGETPSHFQVFSIDQLVLLRFFGHPKLVKSTVQDTGALLYTSGTTGRPKAVALKNYIFALTAMQTPEDISQSNFEGSQSRTFTCLPLFHGTGLCGGLIWSLGSSSCCCLSRRFSASHFSRQLTESGATRMMYVGEICRFLLAAPPSEYDRAHLCVIAWGNGMPKDVWMKFRERFGVKSIREFYRSTENLAKYDNYLNLPGGEGKIGYRGLLGNWLEDDTFLVKVDESTGDLARNPQTGFCVKAHHGEQGEAIGRVRSMELLHVYLNNKPATDAKLVRNVFKKGDLFQRSGDLLVHQADGWIRFQDRSGDTYRWMGENVSAGEVRDHILSLPQIKDVLVYGTKLEGYDGQAGCAAVVLTDDSQDARQEVLRSLPASLASKGVAKYAIPRLLRFVHAIPTGPTFKHTKPSIAAESWDPRTRPDGQPLYWLRGSHYELLDSRSWSNIEQRKARL